MRFIPILLIAILAFIVTVGDCQQTKNVCETYHGPCESDEHCRFTYMEGYVPRCTDGRCDNYLPDPCANGDSFCDLRG